MDHKILSGHGHGILWGNFISRFFSQTLSLHLPVHLLLPAFVPLPVASMLPFVRPHTPLISGELAL